MATTNISNTLNNSNLPSFQNAGDTSRAALASDLINLQPQAAGKRIFISGVNSLLGHSLFEELRNDHIAIHTGDIPNKFFGTVNEKDSQSVPVPSQSIKVLDYKMKPRTFKKQILNSDIFILDNTNGGDLDEAEYIIKLLKTQGEAPAVTNQGTTQQQPQFQVQPTAQKEQIVIVVTSVMTWVRTPKKLKKNMPKRSEQDDSEIEDSQANQLREDESETEDDPINPANKVLYFMDKDYQTRVPLPRYQQLKTLEMLALSAQKTNKKLRVHILCAGLPYGNGEQNNVFYEFFRRAWLSLHQDLASLPIINQGLNRIPTIHIVDLARCIKHLMTNKISQQYFIAVDQAKAQTQASIMKTISTGMGSGLVKTVDLSDVIDEEWAEFLAIDLKLKVSQAFDKAPFWHCRKGICKSTMQMLNEEFNIYRGLFPLKLFVTGPPASGKTHFAQKLSEAYGVPHLKIVDLIQMGYKLQDHFGDEIRKKAEEIKDQEIELYNKTKKKKDPELDRNAIKVRLPDDILHRLLKLQMNSAACTNKGFILDGYPRNINDAKNIFLHKIENYQPPVHNDGAESQSVQESLFPGFEINKDIIPQYCIVLQGEDLHLKQRVKELPLDKVDGTHHNDQGMDRRLKVYREHNQNESGNCVQDFFIKIIGRENTKHTSFDKEFNKHMGELQEFIERNGKPCCLNLITEADTKFLKSLEKKGKVQHIDKSHVDASHQEESKHQIDDEDDEEDEVLKMIRREEQDEQQRKDDAQEKMKQDLLEDEVRKSKEAQDQVKLEKIRQQERDLLDTRSQPIRQYLMDNVVPHLTEGLIDLCKRTPTDPVEYLSDFLLKRADLLDQQRIHAREQEIKTKLEAKAKRDAMK